MQGSKVTVQGLGGFPLSPGRCPFGVSLGRRIICPLVTLLSGSCRQREGSRLIVCLVGLSGALGGVALEMALSLLHDVAWLSQGLGTLPDLYCFCLV